MKLFHKLVFALSLLACTASAQNQPDYIPGFSSADWDSSIVPGKILAGTDTNGSVAIAEIDGNSANGKEMVVATSNGIVQVVKADGSMHWTNKTPNSDCPFTSSANKVYSSPTVANLKGNGVPYVLIGYGGIGGTACGGGVIAWNGVTGQVAWNLDLVKFSRKQRFWSFSPTVFSTISAADTDGDGLMEIGFGSYDRNIYLVNSDGKVIFYYTAADTVWSSAAFADINGDGRKEMLIGSDISQNKALNPPTSNGGFVYALNTKVKKKFRKGKKPMLYSFRDSRVVLWHQPFEQTIFSSPSVGELDPANPGLELAVGSGCYFPEGSSNKSGKWVKIISIRDGKILKSLPTTACLTSSPALGDLDGDGQNEVVATVIGHSSVGGPGLSRVVAWNPRTGAELWSQIPRFNNDNNEWLGQYASAVIADIDGNGSLEVMVSNGKGLVILEGTSGDHLTCSSALASCAGDSFIVKTNATLSGTPAIGDINGDGILEAVFAGKGSVDPRRLRLFALTNFSLLGSSPGPHEEFAAPWPMYRGNAARDGLLRD